MKRTNRLVSRVSVAVLAVASVGVAYAAVDYTFAASRISAGQAAAWSQCTLPTPAEDFSGCIQNTLLNLSGYAYWDAETHYANSENDEGDTWAYISNVLLEMSQQHWC